MVFGNDRILFAAAFSLVGASGCASVFGLEEGVLRPSIEVSGALTKDSQWYADQTVFLADLVTVEAGVTLNIQPGTRILAREDAGILVKPGARIIAKGTKNAPIVFTSALESPEPGDWRGVVLCGRAPLNGATGGARVLDVVPSIYAVACGGMLDDDDSGELSYVRIEYAGSAQGAPVNPAALHLEGVGSRTILHHVQVHRANGDAIDFRGGSVSAKHLLATMFLDDGFDWAYGWRGKAQFIGVVMGDLIGDSGLQAGLETDDSVIANMGDAPSDPLIYNVTALGHPEQFGSNLKFRDGTRGRMFNLLVADSGNAGLGIEDPQTHLNAEKSLLDIRGSIFANENNFADDEATFAESTWAMAPQRQNRALTPADRGILPFAPTAINLALTTGAPALSGAIAPPEDGFFDPSALFVGACGEVCPDFEGWTAFPE